MSKRLNLNPKPMNALSPHPFCKFYPNFRFDLSPPRCISSPKIGDEQNLKWINLKQDLTPVEKIATSQLPPKMSNRGKALMNRVICFSRQDENLHFLLASWVKTMKPRRADWLAVLKEMKRIEHPLYIEVIEYALLEDTFEACARDYTKLIHTFGKQNNLDKAERTLDDMKRRGFPCDLVTLTTLVDIYGKTGNLKCAKEIFDEIKLLGLDLDTRAYGSMIIVTKFRFTKATRRPTMLNMAGHSFKSRAFSITRNPLLNLLCTCQASCCLTNLYFLRGLQKKHIKDIKKW